ncbi:MULTISPECIES: aminoacyl-tRNA hydrolase [Nitrosomonas]|uniref:Peptidyl-tRNA hydrolase n=1 Tax=Nitrosomonas europaea (strain ATCC 19718 / CIP 103999 / KCTC 2705 / NBRC 14298) TaxID=228410 RepID=PTH_NITEU|nr:MULTISPECIES: aminoacyl-tRNA hydrolase [Nitrosomonas]Q82TQ6.1 RecName: Full=Peptidyl-tRNA hydrolase; Short=PTH [Nitrosomonas europaea ATCC 19718]KXK44005.1 MAG: peptidyl-tRNA hydrolase [Nitrosomonas europaea]MBV6389572.1 Peptidyl-tRNA hydrolase [Nitrosomonas europaea]MEB2331077.1 aminoacyl-tRNA hydrolase [Nitrosomonas sp.]QOJ09309.1 MAG: aminoacyl-tRNA hydrolase [Nitrosomonas sp. H1_AOB3]CAD85735.1 Peptidyl-tRNA hydrolase [Nitrosomonas europaea ATCC 19718]
MELPVRLVVGLGNPGEKYASTRHNVGFDWLDRLASSQRVAFTLETRFRGLCARIMLADTDIWLLKPQTYMNASGMSVAAVCRYYKIVPEQMLVVHDELDLQPGVIKLKSGGGTGGHNGLKSIVADLSSQVFWRLRIGVGHPGDRNQVVDYVLHPPRREEAALIDEAIDHSMQVWPLIARGDFAAAMQRLHTRQEN